MEGVRGYPNCHWCVGSQGRDMTAREPPLEQNGLPPMANIMQIASAIRHMCLPCLPGGGWVSPCVLWLMVVLLTSFLWWVWFYLWGIDAFLWNGCGIEGQNFVVLLQGSKINAGFRYQDLILVI